MLISQPGDTLLCVHVYNDNFELVYTTCKPHLIQDSSATCRSCSAPHSARKYAIDTRNDCLLPPACGSEHPVHARQHDNRCPEQGCKSKCASWRAVDNRSGDGAPLHEVAKVQKVDLLRSLRDEVFVGTWASGRVRKIRLPN